MEYTEYTVTAGGGVSVTVPVFHGEENACRMNLFYETALSELYRYGCELTENDRRGGFFCRPSVTEEDGIVVVSLQLTRRRSGEPSARKTVVHRWQDGYLRREKKMRSGNRLRSK